MPAPIAPPDDLDEAIGRYQAGVSGEQVSHELGVTWKTFRRWLLSRGVQPRTLGEATRRTAIPEGWQARSAAYAAGSATGQALAAEYGVSVSVIQRWLRHSGIAVRGIEEASRLRSYHFTPERKRAQAAAAHAARRGSRNTRKMGVRRAATVERMARFDTKDEAALAFWLAKRGYVAVVQKAIGIYNVDLAFVEVAPVAVEVLGQAHVTPSPHGAADPLERRKYILDSGWSLIEVVTFPVRYALREAAADQVITFLERTRANEAPRGQYRVITGKGELLA